MPTSVLFEPHDSGLPYDIGPVAEYAGLDEPLFYGFGRSLNKKLIVVVPYWSIIIPLTALSAFLLLTKPRKSTPKKITEPNPAEGA